jgi:hypothetical protein
MEHLARMTVGRGDAVSGGVGGGHEGHSLGPAPRNRNLADPLGSRCGRGGQRECDCKCQSNDREQHESHHRDLLLC